MYNYIYFFNFYNFIYLELLYIFFFDIIYILAKKYIKNFIKCCIEKMEYIYFFNFNFIKCYSLFL